MKAQVRIQWLDGADRTVPLPAYQSAGAAGADIRANLPPEWRQAGISIPPGGRVLIPTGIAVEIPEGYELQVRPRSGLALKHGIVLLNSPGTIDSDYRGPLGVIVMNAGAEPFTVAHGDRIAQLVLAAVAQARFEPAETLSDTARGAGGFGSTGIAP